MNEPANDPMAHILVVDDDARLRDLLARFLGNAGFRGNHRGRRRRGKTAPHRLVL